MTLQLEQLTDLTPEDRDDLINIYTHGPHCELRIPEMPEIAEDATRLIRNVQDRDRVCFYAGRFNSRLIVAAVALVQGGIAQIDSICVRQSSAGRDVEARFMRRLLDHFSGSENEIILHVPEEPEWLSQLPEPAGFEMDRDPAGRILFRRLHADAGNPAAHESASQPISPNQTRHGKEATS